MADLAEPLKQDCNISLPHNSFYQGCSNCLCVCCMCVRVCTCISVELVVSLGPAAKAEHDHIALPLSLLFSPDERWRACVHTAWKTHFQRRKSGFETNSPPSPPHPFGQLMQAFKCRNPKSGKKKKKKKSWKSLLDFPQGAKILPPSHNLYSEPQNKVLSN